MPTPRGRTSTRVITNNRAIVLEAEWMVMPSRVADILKPLINLAKEQGWRVEAAADGTRLCWRGPNGEGPVYTGYRCQGREFANYRTQLVRAGLKLNEDQSKGFVRDQEVEKMFTAAEADPMSVEEIAKMLDTVTTQLSMLTAKAALFDKARADSKEWAEIAQDAQDAAEALAKRVQEQDTLLDAIRQCFSLAPWAIVGEVAKLLEIDVSTPMQTSPRVSLDKKASAS